ncbi:MAG: hypothetical protein HRT68_04285 [Flavobacteriaceae bacterium]|nr:hypothetical protein [Flavobacteriaceae bacterium]
MKQLTKLSVLLLLILLCSCEPSDDSPQEVQQDPQPYNDASLKEVITLATNGGNPLGFSTTFYDDGRPLDQDYHSFEYDSNNMLSRYIRTGGFGAQLPTDFHYSGTLLTEEVKIYQGCDDGHYPKTSTIVYDGNIVEKNIISESCNGGLSNSKIIEIYETDQYKRLLSREFNNQITGASTGDKRYVYDYDIDNRLIRCTELHFDDTINDFNLFALHEIEYDDKNNAFFKLGQQNRLVYSDVRFFFERSHTSAMRHFEKIMNSSINNPIRVIRTFADTNQSYILSEIVYEYDDNDYPIDRKDYLPGHSTTIPYTHFTYEYY